MGSVCTYLLAVRGIQRGRGQGRGRKGDGVYACPLNTESSIIASGVLRFIRINRRRIRVPSRRPCPACCLSDSGSICFKPMGSKSIDCGWDLTRPCRPCQPVEPESPRTAAFAAGRGRSPAVAARRPPWARLARRGARNAGGTGGPFPPLGDLTLSLRFDDRWLGRKGGRGRREREREIERTRGERENQGVKEKRNRERESEREREIEREGGREGERESLLSNRSGMSKELREEARERGEEGGRGLGS